MSNCILRFYFFVFLITSFASAVIASNEYSLKSEAEAVSAKVENSSSVEEEQSIDLAIPLHALPELIFGPEDAPSKIIVYLSFTCEYCKKFLIEELPILKQFSDRGEIRILIRPYIDTDTSRETTAIIKCLCGNSQKRLEKLFWLAFEHQDNLMKIVSIDDVYNFLKKILPKENISYELIMACKNNQKIYSGIMIGHYRTTYNSEISSAPAFIIKVDKETQVHQGFLTCDDIKQKIAQIKSQQKENQEIKIHPENQH